MVIPLTKIDPEFERRVAMTLPGMAHWAETGPPGTTCGQCARYGYEAPVRDRAGNTIGVTRKDKRCELFWVLMRQHGAKLPLQTPSCRHFKRNSNDP
jgi:hypothetical protein